MLTGVKLSFNRSEGFIYPSVVNYVIFGANERLQLYRIHFMSTTNIY